MKLQEKIMRYRNFGKEVAPMSQNPPAASRPPPSCRTPGPPQERPAEWLDAAADPRAAASGRLRDRVHGAKSYAGELTVWVDLAAVAEVCAHLKAQGYTYLVDIVGIHQPKVATSLWPLSYLLHHWTPTAACA